MNYLTLINKKNLMKDNYYKNIELVDCIDIMNNKIKIEKETFKSFLQLQSFLEKKKIFIGIDSAFRSIEEQEKIYNDFIYKYGKDYTNNFVAPIGASEHQTGLAIDLSIKVNGEFITSNEEIKKHINDFEQIHEYLKEFGFILRYPKNKKNITDYSYEPWHIRYVGSIPATIMYNNELCLEEYLNSYSGILVVNKEKGVTSRDVVNEVSHILGIKKIGHTGTLDPLAEGVLVLTIGRATKIGELLTSYTKEYIAGVKMGILTDTLDITGNILKEVDIKPINFNNLLNSFNKTYMQEVPIYSAVKVNGKKLYEYARNGIKVELPKKEVTIKEIGLLDKDNDSFKFRCLVTKGTYIRSLIRDMGESCNSCFTMSSLTRTKQGDFSIDNSYSISDIKNNNFVILDIENVLHCPIVDMDDKLYKKIINGCKINNIYNINDKIMFKYKNKLVAIYQKENNLLKIWKMLV